MLQGPRVSIRSKAICAAPLCEVLSPCRGLRPHHVQRDRIGSWEVAEDVLSISPTNYDLAPALTDPFRKRFGYFMAEEAITNAIALDVLVQAIERAKSAKPQ